MSPGIGILWALMFGVPFALLNWIRTDYEYATAGVVTNLIANVVVLFILNSVVFYVGMPAVTFYGLVQLIFFNLLMVFLIGAICDGSCSFASDEFSFGAGTGTAIVAMIVLGFVCVFGYNSGHSAHKATNIVKVTVEPKSDLPASSTTNLVIVSPDIATTKAQQAMSTGIAGQRNFSTYLQLDTPTLQYVDGHMWYVFSLYFDGSGNKHRLHSIEPGYIMVNAEDPNANTVERYDGQYSMTICHHCGQQSEPVRYAYTHGYPRAIDDPTLELDDQGNPYWTETVITPHLGWTFYAPTKVLVINAHTGKITAYNPGQTPDWVDRVYSQKMAGDIAGWYGKYKAGFTGVGSSNANRFKLSGDPVLVYTGDGHPDWRMLLTSYNADSSVSKIIIMDANSGAMRVYTPAQAMGTEDSVGQAFASASGQGATGTTSVKANNYQPVDLTLHVIYGHLTWMATYEPEGGKPSFVGVGFVDAYHPSANNAVFGTSKSAALQNYLTQLASESNANGNDPNQGGNVQTVSGKIAEIGWDVSGGQKLWYLTLVGHPDHAYVGISSNVGPAIVLAQAGDSVIMSYQNEGPAESTSTLKSFSDASVPLAKPGA